jgi:uncharacterized YigZ family protein
MEQATYNTISGRTVAEYKDRGSKFLGHALPVSTPQDFKSCMQELKKAHPKATHHCFAYRLGFDGLQFRTGDAGEPRGSAGKPILGQIDRLKVTNVLVVVIRYFGGTLLGIPGLIQGYKTAAALALQMTPVVTLHRERGYRLHFDYTVLDAVMQVIHRHHCSVIHQDTQMFCSLEIGVPLVSEEVVVRRLKEIPGLTLQPSA